MKKLKKILIINGPNLNLLGSREPDLYGSLSLGQINRIIKKHFFKQACFCFLQTNYEGKIIDYLQKASKKYCAVLLNAGGYSHTSIAISDAIRAIPIPVVTVHLTDINNREDYRKKDFVGDASHKVFCGKKHESYLEAISYLLNYFQKS